VWGKEELESSMRLVRWFVVGIRRGVFKMAKRDVNKTALVKDYLAKHPDAMPKAVADALAEFEITPSYVSNIKLKLKSGWSAGTGRGHRTSVETSNSGEQVVAAAGFIKACGGIEEARESLALAEKVARVLE
jgi:hypothetical protein